ncbi:MAG: hypothetical protein ACRD1Y_02550 [Terriglobales bacterium]
MVADRRPAIYVALIFVSGLLLGATVMNLAEHYWLHAHAANEYDISQHRLVAQRMKERLHLSTDQQKGVDSILQQTMAQYLQLEHHLAPQFDQIRQQDRAQLRALLTPDQRADFDKIVSEVDAEYPINERPAVLSPVPCERTTAVASPSPVGH